MAEALSAGARARLRYGIAVVAALLAAAGAGVVSPRAVAQTGGTGDTFQQWTFGANDGKVQTFQAPEDLTLTIYAYGAPGGVGESQTSPHGAGSLTIGRFAVKQNQYLGIWVGENGGHQGGWGYGCGGSGGNHGFMAGPSNGSGGGGATAVVLGTTESPPPAPDPFFEAYNCDHTRRPTPVEYPQIVIGGGGGGGGGSTAWPGGDGGDGGNPPTSGGPGGQVNEGDMDDEPVDTEVAGGCGGCASNLNGVNGLDGAEFLQWAGAGGGGGGLLGGDTGQTGGSGGGGGGGSSYVGGQSSQTYFLRAPYMGSGMVVLSNVPAEIFACGGSSNTKHRVSVPSGAGIAAVQTIGGSGGDNGSESGIGGSPGRASADLLVKGGDTMDVFVGCAGHFDDGSGWFPGGGRGHAGDSQESDDGGAGGGATGVALNGQLRVLAGGGGAGGGDGGGDGGSGGNSDIVGHRGGDGHGPGTTGVGGCGGCRHTSEGGTGHDGASLAAGGGGGGGAGWFAGAGGGGADAMAGGGGGGGGLSGILVADDTFNPVAGTAVSSIETDGSAIIQFLPPGPAAVAPVSGSGQSAYVGYPYPLPLKVVATNAAKAPLNEALITFTLPAAGPAFAGGAKTAVVRTDAQGIAQSPALTAGTAPGDWTVTAQGESTAPPAQLHLKSTLIPTSVDVTPSDRSIDGNYDGFTALVTSPVGVPPGVVAFAVDGLGAGSASVGPDGTATTLTIAPLRAGQHTVEAIYVPAPLSPQLASSSVTRTFPVGRAPTTVGVRALSAGGPVPAVPGAPVVLLATIAGPPDAAPYEGSVTFALDGTTVGTAPVNASGAAVLSVNAPPTSGGHAVTVTAPATADRLPAQGSAVLQVASGGSGKAVEVSTDSFIEFQRSAPVTLTASVAPGPATGAAVTFRAPDGTTLCTTSIPAAVPFASCTVAASRFALGQQSVRADVVGIAGIAIVEGSTIVTVVPATTAVLLNPGLPTPGRSMTAIGIVTHSPTSGLQSAPTGGVQFSVNGVDQGVPVAVRADGTVRSAALPLRPGANIVAATYLGDSQRAGSVKTEVVTVQASSVSVNLDASRSSVAGESPRFDATVVDSTGAPVNAGSIRFSMNGVAVGDSVPLAGGRATSPPAPPVAGGRHHVTARYVPSTLLYAAAEDSAIHTVALPTSVAIATNVDEAGQPLRAVARVHPVGGDGTVSFAVDGRAVDACQNLAVTSGQVVCDLSSLGTGSHAIAARYSGTELYVASDGTLTIVVGAATPPPVRGVLARTGSGLPLMGLVSLAIGLTMAGLLLHRRRGALSRR
ncbi:MAG: Ig-like domain repeat protein [Acidimicrobiales bacterium]